MHHAVMGALINSALYLSAAFSAGLALGNSIAWKLSLMAMGLTFMSHVAQIFPSRLPSMTRGLILMSWVLGAAAGLALIV